MRGYHASVLLKETVDALMPNRFSQDGLAEVVWYLDCTLGDGGHSLEILKLGGKVIGIDVDPQSLERVKKRFEDEGINQGSYILIQGNFRDIKNLIKQTEIDGLRFRGIVFDLGVSSLQLESPERGFSFATEGPLDMRMDPDLGVRALDLINILSRKELYELFSKLGEEKFAWPLAKAVVSARGVKGTGDRVQWTGIKTTKDLAELVEKVVGSREKIPAYAKASAGKHPATRVFQALRIAVNDELGALKEGLDQVLDLIEKDGTILVISFHSLEDRIVKTTFRKWQFEGLGQVLTKKPIVPTDEEIKTNPRSRSAKMRIFKTYDYHQKI